MDVGGSRDRIVRDNDTVRSGEVAATAAHLDVRVGDRVRYRGTTHELRVGEVLDIIDKRLVLIRRPAPASENWHSLNGGVWPIKRERIIEVIPR